MAGFNSITGGQSIIFGDNLSFDGTQRGGIVTADGQIFIGSNVHPYLAPAVPGSSDSSITWTPGHNTLTAQVTGGTTVGKTITGNDGTVLSPTAGNWNILGRSGSKTSGSASTLTIQSPPFSHFSISGTSLLNSGEFIDAAVTRTLPVSAGLLDGDLFIYVCTTAGALVIQAVGAQKIRIGNQISSVAGTATSNSIGDCLTLRFNATDGFFYSVSAMGTWTLA